MRVEPWQVIAIVIIGALVVAFIIDCIRSKRESWAIKYNRKRFHGAYKELYGPLDFMDAGDLNEEDRPGIGKNFK